MRWLGSRVEQIDNVDAIQFNKLILFLSLFGGDQPPHDYHPFIRAIVVITVGHLI